MRKLLSIVLCLVMVFCFTVPAMAASTVVLAPSVDEDTKTDDIPVNVIIDATNPVYKVTVEWNNDLTFTYDYGTWQVSDITDLHYSDAKWDKTSETVTVTNYSNAKVYIKPSLSSYSIPGVTVKLTEDDAPGTPLGDTLTLGNADTGVTGAKGVATVAKFDVCVEGHPTNVVSGVPTTHNLALTVILAKTNA